jgi:G3E family GTPase
VRLILIGGFLGAGKTTTMLAAGRALEARGEKVAVIVNDQGADLVDGRLARAAGLSGVGEVTGGCFCCRFEDLTSVLARIADTVAPSVVLAEAVGSCTDLQSTVVAPFRAHHPGLSTAPLAVLVDPVRYAALSPLWRPGVREPDLSYLYRHQIDEAELIVLNKSDLLTTGQRTVLEDDVARRFPRARRLVMSARTGEGLPELLAFWAGASGGDRGPGHRGFAVDYDRYGAAEAELAWTNQRFTLRATGPAGFDADAWARRVLAEVGSRALHGAAGGHLPGGGTGGGAGHVTGDVVGHVKLHLAAPAGSLTANLAADGAVPSVTGGLPGPVREAEVVLNARLRTDPDRLRRILDESLAAADVLGVTGAARRTGEIFRPGCPVPVHRM